MLNYDVVMQLRLWGAESRLMMVVVALSVDTFGGWRYMVFVLGKRQTAWPDQAA